MPHSSWLKLRLSGVASPRAAALCQTKATPIHSRFYATRKGGHVRSNRELAFAPFLSREVQLKKSLAAMKAHEEVDRGIPAGVVALDEGAPLPKRDYGT